MELENVTLVTIAGTRYKESYEAIKKSYDGIKFGDIKYISPKKIESNNDKINFIKLDCEKLDYINYNKFVVYDLKNYIDTEYVLLIQDDGYVVNPESWRNDFYRYDYIGAIWPVPDPNDKISYRDPFGNLIRVGNGGFSLRSKKLLELPSKLNLEWKSYYGFWNEDGFLTCHNRHILEKEGIKFATTDVAKYFSHECPVDEIKGIDKPFGFHGKNSKYYVNN